MSKTTGIEWADATWNPWMGCTKVSAGCANCYMFREQKRFGHDPTVVRRSKTTFMDPLKWKEPKRIFVCSWSDFFLDDVPIEWMLDALEIIDDCPQHTFMLLTKRPENIQRVLQRAGVYDPVRWLLGMPNVWLGVSVESDSFMRRLFLLEQIPAKVRFVSAEPLLGPLLGLSAYLPALDWVIVGGESGPGARPIKLDWVRDIRDQCVKYGVPFFFKQWGGTSKVDGTWGGRLLDGRIWDELPRVFGPVEERRMADEGYGGEGVA